MAARREQTALRRDGSRIDGRRERVLKATLDALGMCAIACFSDREGHCLMVASEDWEAVQRQVQTYAKGPVAFAWALYAPGKEVARVVIAEAVCALERDGAAREGRWVLAGPEQCQASVQAVSEPLHCRLLTPEQRLAIAVDKTDRLGE